MSRTICSVALLFGAVASAFASEFETAFTDDVHRTWVGPDFFANRILDWQVQSGRAECLIGTRAKPMRTLHLLTHRLADQPGGFTMRVHTGSIEDGGEAHANTWTGFLIGVGGPHVDFRTSALSHHWPGDDGGTIVAYDGLGRVIFRDNHHWEAPKGPRPNFTEKIWPLMKEPKPAAAMASNIILELTATPNGSRYNVTLNVTDADTGDVVAGDTLIGLSGLNALGNVALISHNSLDQEGAGYWFDDFSVAGEKFNHEPENAFGPIISTQYTLHENTVKMTAQMAPIGEGDAEDVSLEVQDASGDWNEVATASIVPLSYTAVLRADDWDDTRDTPYRVVYSMNGERRTYDGTIRKNPVDKNEVVIAAFTGHHISAQGGGMWNGDHIWYPHADMTELLVQHDPDLLFFSGDQIYEGGLAGIVREPTDQACLDYLYHWYRWCWAFRDLTRDRPTIAIPDDHDVYHGNIWGAGGKAAKKTGSGKEKQDSGGYTMHPDFVNAVHRTQVSNLPDPHDPTPILQDITVYYTDMNYGGISFAIIADRMWKDSPTVMVPEGNVINGWFEAPGYDPRNAAVPEASLLGERQESFLKTWLEEETDAAFNVLLSQTIFNNVATLPSHAINDTVVPGMRQPSYPGEYMEGDKFVADGDSNGWPQPARNRAIEILQNGCDYHIAGDQHLASFIQYGVDGWRNGPYAFCVPSIANVWPRRWFPPEPGANQEPGAPRYTGDFEDGFGNKMTVHAVANPNPSELEPSALYDRAPGYGIVRFNKAEETITAECWPRWVDPWSPVAEQYPGWPITVGKRETWEGRD